MEKRQFKEEFSWENSPNLSRLQGLARNPSRKLRKYGKRLSENQWHAAFNEMPLEQTFCRVDISEPHFLFMNIPIICESARGRS